MQVTIECEPKEVVAFFIGVIEAAVIRYRQSQEQQEQRLKNARDLWERQRGEG